MDISSLLTSSGKINSAIIRREHFKSSGKYSEIMENSKELDVFTGILLSERIWFAGGYAKLEKCNVCEKPYIVFKHTNHRYSLCNHKQNIENYVGKNHEVCKDKKSKLIELVDSHPDCILSDDEFKEGLDSIPSFLNYNFSITGKNMNLFHDILVKTKSILPLSDDLRMAERAYLVKNNLNSLPICRNCGNPVSFIDRFKGYRAYCEKCRNIGGNETRIENQNQKIEELVDTGKYEIVSLPGLVNKEPLVIKCRKCGKTSDIWLYNGGIFNIKNKPLCRNCEIVISKPENELYELCRGIVGESNIVRNDRTVIAPKELDIYIPEKKLAIEFNGAYWHSDACGYSTNESNRNRHLVKTELCDKIGIRLFHVFEYDWESKRTIIESMIRNMLGVSENTVYARNCVVGEVSSSKSSAFLNENHLQGNCNASVRLGLFHSGELVSLMTFCKPRFSKKHDWELVRFCSKCGFHVPGAASRLFKRFVDEYKPKSVVSYADRSRSNGNLYLKLGFELEHISPPDYKYIGIHGEIVSRILAQKHRLPELLGDMFDSGLSESENMKNAGYSRIYDCGNLVFVKNISELPTP